MFSLVTRVHVAPLRFPSSHLVPSQWYKQAILEWFLVPICVTLSVLRLSTTSVPHAKTCETLVTQKHLEAISTLGSCSAFYLTNNA